MTYRRLIQYFDRLVEAKGGVTELRGLVVQLAVYGKLLEASGDGGDGQELYRRVAAGIKNVASSHRGCRWKPSARVESVAGRTTLPPSWTWARLNDTGLYVNGLAFKPSDWHKKGIPIIRIQNLSDEGKEFNYANGHFADENLVRPGDLLVSWSATLDAFIWNRGEGVLNQHIFKVIPNEAAVMRGYLFWLLKHEIRMLATSDHAHGLAMKHINRGPFLAHVVPLPPLEDQQVILAKLTELLSLCDGLEAAHTERERRRRVLLEAVLDEVRANGS